jgi:hypothetical protein
VAVGLQATIAGAIAGIVGVAELVSRYRSEPTRALGSIAAWLYVALNAAAGVGALYLVRAFGWNFGQSHNVTLWRILVAGFGALALFRSSLFVAKVGGSNVGVGPSVALEQLLGAFDRNVDRKCAANISKELGQDVFAKLNPGRVMATLPVLCLALMQNFSQSDQAVLGADITKAEREERLSPEAKMRVIVICLAKYLGAPLVKQVLIDAKALWDEPAAVADVVATTKTIP